MSLLSLREIKSFRALIWDYYYAFGRTFSWRNTDNHYHIVISEIMLQQTQTFRVEPKYEQFVARFPNFNTLVAVSLRDILTVWQGLGYNRRVKMLQQIAQRIVDEFNGNLPADPEILVTFPGIGKSTAASICAFAFNMPTIFVETNIRTVFIAHFFSDVEEVHDRDILKLVEQTIDKEKPREWYYALMDYGVFLKKNVCNHAKQSVHYSKQSRFEGSDRQIRGLILKTLLKNQSMNQDQLIATIDKESARVENIIMQLCQEGLVCTENDQLSIA